MSFINKIFNQNNFQLKPEKLTLSQNVIFWLIVIVSVILKIIIIPYNMMDAGDNATRVWNALWWANHPFFVMPESGNPLWFYFMGPIIKITGEIFYTPIISMIILMTIAGIFIFKSTLLLTDFKTALLSFCIVILNPVIFRLNFQPYAQTLYLAAACIMLYFLIKALFTDNSTKYFILAGIFAFVALGSRPEGLFVMLPLALFAALSKKKGAWSFVILSIAFQLIWSGISYFKYGSFFRTFEAADEYAMPVDIEGTHLGLRMKGFFLPYYFLVFGLTFVLFYYFVKGFLYSYKNFPMAAAAILLIMILAPALITGIAGAKSTIYHTTNYIYLMFFISPVFCAVGLNKDLSKMKSTWPKVILATVIILSCIPLSYIKEYVPYKYNKLFPKVIQFIVTADEPEETRKLLNFIDDNIGTYPALIFDSEENTSSIFYVPFRTRLAPPEKILISGYNVPADSAGLQGEIDSFVKKNPAGIIMIRKGPTTMHAIFNGLLNKKPYKRNDIGLAQETDLWLIYTYKQER
jgi:hypothetical protein